MAKYAAWHARNCRCKPQGDSAHEGSAHAAAEARREDQKNEK